MTLCCRIVVCVLMLLYELIYCVWRRFVANTKIASTVYMPNIMGSFSCSLCRIQWRLLCGYYVMEKVYMNRRALHIMTIWAWLWAFGVSVCYWTLCGILGLYCDFLWCRSKRLSILNTWALKLKCSNLKNYFH